jgi:hypothetical protein
VSVWVGLEMGVYARVGVCVRACVCLVCACVCVCVCMCVCVRAEKFCMGVSRVVVVCGLV